MVCVRFRLVKVGVPEAPVRVFSITQDDGPPIFHEGEFSEPLQTTKRLEELTLEDLPDWLLHQQLPLTLAPPQRAIGSDAAAAWRAMHEAASAAYSREVPAVEAVA
jgi:hypothetical protein